MPFDTSEVKTLKYQTLNSEASRLCALCHIETFPIGTSHLVGTRNKNCPLGSRVPKRPKHPRLSVLSHFDILPIRIFGAGVYKGNLPLCLSGTETPKRRFNSHYAISRFRKLGLHDTRGRRVTFFDFPSTEKLIHPLVIPSTKIQGFADQRFTMCVDRRFHI
jgi:hypothetical protein